MFHHIKGYFTTYATPVQVRIRSPLLAITYLALVVMVWVAYLTSLDLNLKNIYQKACPVDGAVIIKVKGILSTADIPDSEFQVPNPQLYKRIYDSSDLIFPPYDVSSSFIALTNLLITPNQTRGLCPEPRQSESGGGCGRDEDCPKGSPAPGMIGIRTGKCDPETSTCQLSAWCPPELNIPPLKGGRALFESVQDFTVMIKNSVEFPLCGEGLKYRNILESFPPNYLSTCVHSKKGNGSRCPIFRLRDVIEWSGSKFEDVAQKGAIFKIGIKWECDFDFGFTANFCFPNYEFKRIDEAHEAVSPGLNFRSSYYYEEDRRSLEKMFGIKFLVVVEGEGKRFDFFQLVLAFGATIALFDLAPLVCDAMFHGFCYLKRFRPFSTWFGHFSPKARYLDAQSIVDHHNSKGQVALKSVDGFI